MAGTNSFTPADEKELARLLSKFRKSGYYWPSEALMREAHNVISYWAPELVIWKRDASCILLARYQGGIEEFDGRWHIPGGYNSPLDRISSSAENVGWGLQTIQPTVSRIAKREIGVDVRVVGLIDLFWWPRREDGMVLQSKEHPYGWPLSLYVECQPLGDIKETDDVRFFSQQDLPAEEEMVSPHWRFLQSHL